MTFWKKKNQEAGGINPEENKDLAGQKASAHTHSLSKATGESKATDRTSSEQADNSKTASQGLSQNQAASNQAVSNQGNEAFSDQSYSKVRSALSAGTVIQGKLSFDTPVRIDGKLSGEVYSSKVLIVGETAQITANIEASSLIIMGKIKGTIKASEKVQICAGSDVDGTIISPSLIIESGARFNGTSDMSNSSKVNTSKDDTKIYSGTSVDLDQMISKNSKATAKELAKELPEAEAPLN